MYEGGIRIPMIARWPGRIAAGASSDFPCYFADFMPTAAELAGTKARSGLDGISIVPTLLGAGAAGREQTRHEFMYWEFPRYDAKTGTFPKEAPPQAVRMGDWKAVRPKPNAPLELYNLEKDLGETRNVAGENPQVMARIEAYLKNARTEPLPQRESENAEWHF
jgi:arylsulfatase A-like enzyme